jgi:putative Holliday junction resolvase
LALSDELGLTAGPLETVPATSWTKAVARIREVVREQDVEGIVLGEPASLKGHRGTLSDDVRRFQRFLEEHVEVDVTLWDERLSSRAADRILREMGGGAKGDRDRIAATWILQGYLDRHSKTRRGDGETG